MNPNWLDPSVRDMVNQAPYDVPRDHEEQDGEAKQKKGAEAVLYLIK